MAQTICSICVYTVEMLTALAFFSKNYAKRFDSNFLVWLVGLCLFIPASFLFNIFNNEIYNLTLSFLINLLFCLICFKIPIKSALIQCVLLDALMFSTELITIFILSAVAHIPTNLYKSNFTVFLIIAIICKTLYLTLSQILAFIIKKKNAQKYRNKYFVPLFIFPLLTIATCVVLLFIALEVNLSPAYQISISAIAALFIFACIFMFLYYQTLIEKDTKISELEAEQRSNQINQVYLEILQHKNDELQMLFHDTKHHYLTLSGFETVEEVKQYIEKLYPELESKNTIRISQNKIIDLILNKYIVLCEKSGIKFNYEVQTANLAYINDVELSIILNNALDNAFESAGNSSEKIIDFSLRHINGMDLLSIVNSCDVAPTHKNKQLISTKKLVKEHGFGNRIIERHTKANNGKYEWFYDETEKKFHLSLLFQK